MRDICFSHVLLQLKNCRLSLDHVMLHKLKQETLKNRNTCQTSSPLSIKAFWPWNLTCVTKIKPFSYNLTDEYFSVAGWHVVVSQWRSETMEWMCSAVSCDWHEPGQISSASRAAKNLPRVTCGATLVRVMDKVSHGEKKKKYSSRAEKDVQLMLVL